MPSTYGERAQKHPNPLARELLELMETKKTNLSVSADLTKTRDLLALADAVGPYICVLKTHVDVLEDFSHDFVRELQALAEKHRFLIFEDRKFADIGNTVKLQYEGGIYAIASWAHIVNCHTVPGPGIITGLKDVGLPRGRALLLLAEMSSQGNLARGDYTRTTVEWARQHSDFVIGFIGMQRLVHDADFITMTPGVALQANASGDAHGQQYRTPQQVICESECDIIIVGRAIYGGGKDVAAEAARFQRAGWDAYTERLGRHR